MDEPFTVYAAGLCFLSVCTSLEPEEVVLRANTEQPTGISSPWALHGGAFRTGEANPHPCEHAPQTHRHYLLSC